MIVPYISLAAIIILRLKIECSLSRKRCKCAYVEMPQRFFAPQHQWPMCMEYLTENDTSKFDLRLTVLMSQESSPMSLLLQSRRVHLSAVWPYRAYP